MAKQHTIKGIDKLLKKYRNTKEGPEKNRSLKELLDSFEGFIIKYANFLSYGYYKKKDKDIISLISMLSFSRDKYSLDRTVELIHSILQSYTFDDIFSELQLKFIQCVNKYVKHEGGPSFTGFIYGYYKFTIKDWIDKLSEDALNKVHSPEFSEDYITDEQFPEQLEVFDNLCFSDATELTNLQKYVLYLAYGRKLTDYSIGKIIGLCRGHVNDIKNKALHKLRNSNYTIDDFKR
jgi:DNA-directed RNA polymerase specialized sigma24 family protein